jgi:hypothetical protein
MCYSKAFQDTSGKMLHVLGRAVTTWPSRMDLQLMLLSFTLSSFSTYKCMLVRISRSGVVLLLFKQPTCTRSTYSSYLSPQWTIIVHAICIRSFWRPLSPHCLLFLILHPSAAGICLIQQYIFLRHRDLTMDWRSGPELIPWGVGKSLSQLISHRASCWCILFRENAY